MAKKQHATYDSSNIKVNSIIISDSVVIWTDDNSMKSFVDIIAVLRHLLNYSLKMGLPLRGSLVEGNGNLLNPLPRIFDDLFNQDLFNWNNSNYSDTNTTIPAVNIKETPENYEVEVAAPGMTKKDFKVELDGNSLTISSERSYQNEEKEGERYSRKEFSYQSFQRTFTLQKDVVDIDKIQAKYENGLLHLIIPKKEEAKQKPPRLIQIS